MNLRITLFSALLLLTAVKSFSQDGSLDLTFGTDGKVITPIGNSNDYCNAAALQPDGKIILVGNSLNGSDNDYALARYNTDGTLDTGFGATGIVTNNFNSSTEILYAIALQPDGKIVVAGKTVVSNYSKFVVMRYLADGTLDTPFGNFGKTVTSIGNFNSVANALVIQTDGKIILAGRTSMGSYDDFAMARYNIDGSLDPTFGMAGVVTTAIGTNNDYGYAVALQNDGKIVVGGSTSNGTSNDFALVRYLENGSLDTSFDTDGKLTTDFNATNDYIYAMTIQSDGKIVAAGSTGQFPSLDFAVARYNIDGSLDTSFDVDGKVITSFGTNDDMGYSIAIQNDNKILVAGYSSVNTINNNKDFASARYNSDGSLDITYDVDGKVLTPIANSNDLASTVMVQSDGKILLAGSSYNGTNNDFSLLRYNSAALGNTNFVVNHKTNIFPNPICSYGTLYFTTFFDHVTVNVLNTTGQKIMTVDDFSGDSIDLNQTDFANGLYFIQFVKQNKTLYTSKFFVKN